MKTLSAAVQTVTDRLHVSPIRIVKIEFSGLTLYLCDRKWGSAGSYYVHNSQIYEPLILSFGSIQSGRIDPITFEVTPGETTITLDNSTPIGGSDNFTSLFLTYDPHFSAVTISEFFEDAYASGDEIILFKGTIEDVRDMRQESVTLLLSSYELSLNSKFQHNILDASTYPNGKVEDIGKMIPMAYGTVTQMPFLAADQGARSTLYTTINDVATTIVLSDASLFPSSGTIQIGGEILVYTGKSSNSLTGVLRGEWGTQATGHTAGTGVGELLESDGDTTLLDGGIASGTTTITVDDTSDFDEVGCIRIDSEEIAYSGTSSTQFLSCTRGINNTSAASHSDNATVTELTNRLIYMAEPVKSIDNVYYNGVRQNTSNYTAYTGQSGDEHPDYSGKAIIEIKGSYLASLITNYSSWVSNNESIHTSIDPAPAMPVNMTSGLTANIGCYAFDINGFTSSSGGIELWSPDYDPYLSRDGYIIEWHFTMTINDMGTDGYFALSTDNGDHGGAQSFTEFLVIENGAYTTYASSPYIERVTNGCPAPTDGVLAFKLWYDGDWDGDIVCYLNAVVLRFPDYGVTSGSSSGWENRGLTYFSGRVTADVQGEQDDGSGTYTGTPNALIENPVHVCKHLLIDKCGLSSDEINSTSYTAAESYCTNFTVNFPILQVPNIIDLLWRISWQARMLSVWDEGKHRFITAPFHGAYTADKTVELNRVDQGQLYLEYTKRYGLTNKATATYKRDWSGYSDFVAYPSAVDNEISTINYQDSASITKYGTLQTTQFSFPYIITENHAYEVIEWRIMSNSTPRLLVDLSGGWFFHEIERGDVLEFSFTSGDYLDKALLGLVVSESDQFQVIDVIRRPDSTIQLELVEIILTIRNLNISDFSSLTSVGAAAMTKIADITASDVVSLTHVDAYHFWQFVNANNLTTATSITGPALDVVRQISASNVTSATEITDGDIGWENINGSNLASSTQIENATVTRIRPINASNVSSVTSVDAGDVERVSINRSLTGTATADAEYGAGYEATKANDNNTTTTRWVSDSGQPHWLQIEFDGSYTIVEAAFYPSAAASGELFSEYYIEYWDGDSWEEAVHVTGYSEVAPTRTSHSVNFTTTKARIRTTSGDNYSGIYELQFWD